MKFHLVFIFSIIVFSVGAQENNRGYLVRYKIVLRFGAARTFTGTLSTSASKADFRFREVNVSQSSLSKDKSVINFDIRDSSEIFIQTNLLSKQLIESAKLPPDKNIYLIEDTIVAIDWKILHDTKKINGHMLSKATGEFRGRTYTAWFAQDVPSFFGPWKFHGLPGLIFEITDEKREVDFQLITLDSEVIYTKTELPKGIPISRAAYRKKQNSMGEDIAKSLASKLGREFTVEVKTNQVKQIEID